MADSNVVYIGGADWERLLLRLKKVGANTLRAADNMVATTAAEGRTDAANLEKRMFKLGRPKFKGRKTGGIWHTSWSVRPKWDASMKGWKTSRGGRMVGFNWENVASRKSAAAFRRAVSSAYAYSLLDNLWENDTKPYGGHSPKVSTSDGTVMRWKKGAVRKGRHYRDTLIRLYEKGAWKAAARVEAKFTEMCSE